MYRFGLTFGGIKKKRPAVEDGSRPNVAAFFEALRLQLLVLQTTYNAVYDAAHIIDATGDELDLWGETFDKPRYDGESDVNWALEFSGVTTEYVEIAYDASLEFSDELTIDIRFKLDNLTANQVLFSRGANNQEITVLSTGAVRWEPKALVAATSLPGVVLAGVWYHLRVIYDASDKAYIYLGELDGELAEIGNAAVLGNLTALSGAIYIGRSRGGTAYPVTGKIDEVRAVAAVVETADGDEVPPYVSHALYTTALMLHCDEGTGITANDETANGNDGTLNGTVVWYQMVATDEPQGYLARLLEHLRRLQDGLTEQAVIDAIDYLGATFTPTISVLEYQPHYRERVQSSNDPEDTYKLGDAWGLANGLDYLTGSAVLERIPTYDEAKQLAAAVLDVAPGRMRVQLVNERPGVNPEGWRLRATAYGDAFAAPLIWDDNYPIDLTGVAGLGDYDIIGTDCWTLNVATGELEGTGGTGGATVNHIILPKLGDNLLFDERDIYIDTTLRINDVGAGSAGLCLRYQDSGGEFYYVAFDTNGASRYAIFYWNGLAFTTLKGWTALGIDMSSNRRVECWIEGQNLRLHIGGTVIESAFALGNDITDAGRFGFNKNDKNVDIYVDELKYW